MTKAEARKAARAARARAHAAGPVDPARVLRDVLADEGGRVVALYTPIRDEIDPLGAAEAVSGRLALPVVVSLDAPLVFREWHPEVPLEPGAFGVPVPPSGAVVVPDVVVVPMLAFDRRGLRLGYGGGFYDRTLAALRADGQVRAIGFAYAAQEMERVPGEAWDAPLDRIVTETGCVPLAP